MTKDRKQKLKKNFTIMFWVQALLNFKMMNVVFTLFYIHRGLLLSHIFYLSIIWAITNLIFEIPSSYLADKWGRKKTILLGISFALINWLILLIADNFTIFAIGIVCLAFQFACFSGTDDALIYDTNKELKNHDDSLKRLGSYYSSRNILKIVTPLIAVFIVKDLVEWQFIMIICIDIIAVLSSFVLAFRIVEPHHYMDVEKQEAGVLKDAFVLIRRNPYMIRGILSKTCVFIASFVIWRYHQDLLINFFGLSVIVLGIAWALYHSLIFLWDKFVTPRFHKDIPHYIDMFNAIFFLVSVLALCVVIVTTQPIMILVCVMLVFFSERIRWSLYSQFFNNYSHSFNRSTTISLSNFLKSILDIPLLFTAALLVGKNMTYPFFLTILLAFITLLFFRISSKKHEPKTS